MTIRIISILVFIILLFNKEIRKNKSLVILISSLIVQKLAILLIISDNIAKFPLNLVIVLTTIIFCIDLVYIFVNGILKYLKRSNLNRNL